jgi:Holliday junction DNA helicase RuvA
MISYLEGRLLKKEEDRVVILVHGVGYEVLLPPIVRVTLNDKNAGVEGDEVSLHIAYFHPERQVRPMLVGFCGEVEKEFFEQLIKVGDIGPTKAVKLLTVPVCQFAQAIEERNSRALVQIKGLGPKLADKIIAHLHGKMGKYALIKTPDAARAPEKKEDMAQEVLEVMVRQLGYKRPEATKMVQEALERNPQVSSAEEIFEEVYRNQKGSEP